MADENPNPEGAEDHSDLVSVFESPQETQTQIVLGLLESAGIVCMESGIDANQESFPGVGGTRVLVVPPDAQEARRIIAEYQAKAAQDAAAEDAADAADAGEGPDSGPAQ